MYYVIGIIVFALLCAICGYIVFRGKGTASSWYKMAVASVFSVPLVLSLLLWVNLLIAARLKLDTSALGDYPFIFALYGMIAVLSPIGWTYYVVTAVFIALAWSTQSKSRSYMIALGVYSCVLLLYVGCNIWWYLTGQQMDFP